MHKLFLRSFFIGFHFLLCTDQPQFKNGFSYEYCPGVCPNTNDMSIAWEQETGLLRAALFYNKDYQRFLARDTDGNPVGVIAMYKCCIIQFAVLKKFQRRGIGTRLFFKAIEHMAQNGCQEARWLALPESVPFYENMGAQCIDSGEQLVRMEFTLRK